MTADKPEANRRAAAGFFAGHTEKPRRSRFAGFWRREVALGLLRSLGALFAPRRSNLYVAYRPDSHANFESFPRFGELNAAFTRQSDNNSGDVPRFYALLLNIARVLKDGVPGDFAELGVYRGHTASILAAAARESGRQLFLFDTFSGFDAADLDGAASKAFTDTSLDAVKALVGTDSVTFIAGRFPDSIPPGGVGDRFAIVHLDADLYQPTRAGLDYFYPRLSAGGLLILHDYSSGHWPGCTQAIDEFFAGKPERPVLLPDKSGTAIVVKG